MTKREGLKPFLWGTVLGGAALAVVAFSADWIVMTSSKDQDVAAAKVEVQASICASLAEAHRVATADVTSLQGYGAREARDALAKTYAIVLQGQESADPAVLRACSNLLDKPSV